MVQHSLLGGGLHLRFKVGHRLSFASFNMGPNPSLKLTCYGLRPPQAA
jgi:hypothetical protein